MTRDDELTYQTIVVLAILEESRDAFEILLVAITIVVLEQLINF